MISLKKHIDEWSTNPAERLLKVYRSLLLAVGKYGHLAIPRLGPALEKKLADLNATLNTDPSADNFLEILTSTGEQATAELAQWATLAVALHKADEGELREIVEAMAGAVESIAARDERYAREVSGLTERLRSITNLDDLASIRGAIIESASSLTACVERLAETSSASLRHMKAEVEDFRARLDKSERLSFLDPLTGLANRRQFEEEMNLRVTKRTRFCLILIDLNDFKAVNDRLGHLAGDDLLKNFAAKLRIQFPSADLVSRWGGDEFAVIITCSLNDAKARVERIRRSAIGEFKIKAGKQLTSVNVDASIGVVEWNGTEKAADLLARADHSMYCGKHSMKARKAG